MKPVGEVNNMVSQDSDPIPSTSSSNKRNGKLSNILGSKTGLPILLKNGDVIEYKISHNDQWNRALIISRGGKTSSKHKTWYNIQNVETVNKSSINLDLVKRWRKIDTDLSVINKKVTLARYLKNNWSKVGSPIAFAGVSKIYKYCRETLGGYVTKKQIEVILSSIPAYTKFKETKKARLYNPVFIYYVHQQWQIDITFVTNLAEWNSNVKYLLVVMECFSRKLFVACMKDKSTESTIEKFDDIHSHIGLTPHTIYMDKGCEFNSDSFKRYCHEYNITPIFSYNSTKAPLIEQYPYKE